MGMGMGMQPPLSAGSRAERERAAPPTPDGRVAGGGGGGGEDHVFTAPLPKQPDWAHYRRVGFPSVSLSVLYVCMYVCM